MVWRERQEQGAVQAGFTAARYGGGEGSWAAAAAAAGNGAAGSSGCGSGGEGGAASPAIAAVGTQQQLDRIEAAIAKLGTELEKMREQLNRLEFENDLWQRSGLRQQYLYITVSGPFQSGVWNPGAPEHRHETALELFYGAAF